MRIKLLEADQNQTPGTKTRLQLGAWQLQFCENIIKLHINITISTLKNSNREKRGLEGRGSTIAGQELPTTNSELGSNGQHTRRCGLSINSPRSSSQQQTRHRKLRLGHWGRISGSIIGSFGRERRRRRRGQRRREVSLLLGLSLLSFDVALRSLPLLEVSWKRKKWNKLKRASSNHAGMLLVKGNFGCSDQTQKGWKL